MDTKQPMDEGLRRTPDWEWLTSLLSEFDITEKRFNRKNARDFTSLEARIYREIQNRYKQRKKPDYVKTAANGRSSKQYEDSQRIHGEQIKTMEAMGYGLMLDGFTFYKIGHELEPYDFERNFQMHQAYEIHDFIHQYGDTREAEGRIDELERLVPSPVAEMASINHRDELERTFDEIRRRIAELKKTKEET